MPSPFPGMDPYLEDPVIWSDFHGTLLVSIRAELNKLLPEGYVARWDRYVWIDDPDSEAAGPLGRPDVFVADTLNRAREETGVSVLSAPASAVLPAVEPRGKPFLKIVEARTHRVVTVLELLSHANKSSGKDREAYLAKRQEYFRSGTNLIEIDFLRSGQRPPIAGDVTVTDYYIIISRAIDYPNAGVWPLSVRNQLPPIPVPLDPQIEPVELSLQLCMNRTFDEGRYDREIDYSQAPNPPLRAEDAAWAREMLSHQFE